MRGGSVVLCAACAGCAARAGAAAPPASTSPLPPSSPQRDPPECATRTLPEDCEAQYYYLRVCRTGERPASEQKVDGVLLLTHTTDVAIALREPPTDALLYRLTALGAVHQSVYGSIVFFNLPPEEIYCVAELPEVLNISAQGELELLLIPKPAGCPRRPSSWDCWWAPCDTGGLKLIHSAA